MDRLTIEVKLQNAFYMVFGNDKRLNRFQRFYTIYLFIYESASSVVLLLFHGFSLYYVETLNF